MGLGANQKLSGRLLEESRRGISGKIENLNAE
jgi:hypothetical protein